MKIKVVKKLKAKIIKRTKKKVKNSNQLELIFKDNKNNNIKNHNKDLSFNYSNTVNSISRVFLSSFAHSIFRSVESGKYLLRSANNGIAAIVNPLGIVEQKVEYGDSGYVDFKKAKKIQPTLFSKYGNKIFITLILLYIFMIFSFNRFKNE
ncbi:hypothetical protein OAP79_02850 [Candidatus Pelagibacter sp.]|nr:hypothetical protein [Candidatus Pelagibacter sp.]